MLFRLGKKKDLEQQLTLLYETPRILLVDIDEDTSVKLSKDGFNITNGSFGKQYSVTSNPIICKTNGNLPDLLEQDLIVIDMVRNKSNSGKNPADKETISKAEFSCFTVPKGQNYFEPSWIYALQCTADIKKVVCSGGILIVYSDAPVDEIYYTANVVNETLFRTEDVSISNYDWLPIPFFEIPHYGYKGSLIGKECYAHDDDIIDTFLRHYEGDISYNCTFLGPRVNEYIPILYNKLDEAVGFIYRLENGVIIVLPQFKDKYSSIISLFKHFLPNLRPDLFPSFVNNNWLQDEEYLFPQTRELLNKKHAVSNDYQKVIVELESDIQRTFEEFSFMTNILISSGDGNFLVDNVIKVLEYIGYKKVIEMDALKEKGDNLQEDLQIHDDGRITIVEIKGHAGNPSEDDCQALNKYINRNMKKHDRRDVHGILIVNHQKYLPPSERQFPAFSTQQIEDAVRDGYTLVDTWQLFQATRLLQEGIIRFDDIDRSLHTPGLFHAFPNSYHSLGKVEKWFKDGTIACLFLEGDEIKMDDEIIVQDGNTYYKQKITEMMVNDDLVDRAGKGDPVSIKLNCAVSRRAKLFR